MIELRPANSGGFLVYCDGNRLGEISGDNSVGYSWWPSSNPRFTCSVTSDTLREIAAELDRLNEEYRKARYGPSSESVGRNYIPSKEDTSQAPF